jgi:plasmid maintenance system antidote protein VapI
VNDSAPDLQLTAKELLVGYMKREGASIRGLADALGVHRCTIDRLRRGKQKTVPSEVAVRMEQELNVPAGQLFVQPTVTRDLRRTGSRKSAAMAVAA